MSMSFSERLLKTVKANIANNIFSTTKRKIAFIACYVMDKIFIGLERDLLKFVNLRSTMSNFKCPLCKISKTKSLIEKKSKLNIMKCLSSEHWSQSYKIVIKLRQNKAYYFCLDSSYTNKKIGTFSNFLGQNLANRIGPWV